LAGLEEQETAVTLETNPDTVPDAEVLEETSRVIASLGLEVDLAWFDSASRKGFLAVRGPLAIVAEVVRRSEFAQPAVLAAEGGDPVPEVVLDTDGPPPVPVEHKVLDADLGLGLLEEGAVLRARLVTDPRLVDTRERFNDLMGRASATLDLQGGYSFDPSSRFGRLIVAGPAGLLSRVVAWPEVAAVTVSAVKERTLRRLVDPALWQRLRSGGVMGLTLSFPAAVVPDEQALHALVAWLQGVAVHVDAPSYRPGQAVSHLHVKGLGFDLLLAIVDLGDRLGMVTGDDFLRQGVGRLDPAIVTLEADADARVRPVRVTLRTDPRRVRSAESFKRFTGLLERLGVKQTGCVFAPGRQEGRITAYATPAALKKLASMPQITSIQLAQGKA
jgi:hypothetical protein